MNLGLVLRGFGGPGGTEKYSADLANWLVSRGHSVTVYCVNQGADVPGVQIHRLDVSGTGWAADRALLAASQRIDRSSHDLVQGFGRTLGHDVFRAGGGVHAAWLAAPGTGWLRRARQTLSPRERWTSSADRAAMVSARRIVTNSERVAQEIPRWSGIEPDRLRVVRTGVDTHRFHPDPGRRARARALWNVPDGGRVALFLGTGFRRKGLAVAAVAFARIAGSKDRFVVVGRDGRSKQRLAAVARVVGDRLVSPGAVTDPERWIPGADCTILPTLYDAAANSTLEAMACGVPPVTSGMDGSSEVVPDSELVVSDPTDAEGFADALAYAWSAGPTLAERLLEVAADWTVERNGKTMETLYSELTHD